MKIMVTSFKRYHAGTTTLSAPNLQQATANPHVCWRLLDTPRQVWVSLLWGHCAFLLGPGAHEFLFVPSKSLFPQSCVSPGSSMMGLMVTFSKRVYAVPICCTQSPCPCGSPLLTRTSTGDKHSKAGLAQSLWGLLVCTGFV